MALLLLHAADLLQRSRSTAQRINNKQLQLNFSSYHVKQKRKTSTSLFSSSDDDDDDDECIKEWSDNVL